jgi:two-component system, OmpR family, response regulator CpxR
MGEIKQRVLLIDDDWELCDLVREYLSTEGYDVEAVHDGVAGTERAVEGNYDLVVLDVMLPGLNGFEVLRRVRASSTVPILMLTARGEEIDRILGLEMGADDYLPKPFNHRELLARLRAIQRRLTTTRQDSEPEVLTVGDVQMIVRPRTVRCGGNLLELTSAEFAVLRILLHRAGTVLHREELLMAANGRQLSYNDRSIDVHMSNLRRKLGPTPDGTERIKSVRGVGYIYPLADPDSRAAA